jgi:hypothetical protein
MNRKAMTLAMLLAVLTGSGCSQMRVTVSIYKPTGANYDAFTEAAVRLKRANVEANLARNTLDQNRYNMAKLRLKDELEQAVDKAPAGTFPASLTDNLNKAVDAAFAKAIMQYQSGVDLAKVAESIEGSSNREARRAKMLAAHGALADGDRILIELKSKISSLIGADVGEAVKDLNGAVVAQIEQSKKQIDSLIGDAGVFDDPMASVIVTAPESQWRGTFNDTWGAGTLGNTDIAVKMQSLGNFSLKGVRLDAQKVTQSTFLGIRQAISLAGAAMGVPIGAPTASGETAAPTAADDVLKADQQLRVAKARQEASRDAARRILAAIVSEQAAITKKEAGDANAVAPIKADRVAAVGRLKTVFTNNR